MLTARGFVAESVFFLRHEALMGRKRSHSAPLRLLATSLAALLALGPGGAARAAPARASVLLFAEVPLPGATDAFASRVSAQVQSELRQRGDLKLVELPARAGQADTAKQGKLEAEKARAQATQLFNKGGELSQKGRAKQAAQSLQKAVTLLTAQPLAFDEQGGKLLGDLLLQLAVTRAMAGDEEGTDAALGELARRDPERALLPGSFPPAFLRSFESDRQRVLSSGRGTIRVTAPEGDAARVLLDGRLLGSAPLQLNEVLPGAHAIRVERGDQAWAAAVQTAATETSALAPRLGAASGDGVAEALSQGSFDHAEAVKLAQLARSAGAQAALVGTVAKEGDGYTVRSALVFAKSERVVPLASLALDAEMLSASLEVLRLADDLVAKLSSPPAPATLPLAMGVPAPALPQSFAAVVAAPPAPESALPLPDAKELAAAAGAEQRPSDLPLPEAAPGEATLPERTPVLAAAPAPAVSSASAATSAGAAARTPDGGDAPAAPPVATTERATLTSSTEAPQAIAPAPERTPALPLPAQPGAEQPAPAAQPPPAAASSAPHPALAGSLDAAMATVPAPAPAAAASTPPDEQSAAPAEGARRVAVPGAAPPSLPAVPAAPPSPKTAPTAAPANAAPGVVAAGSSAESATLAESGPRRAEEPPPSRDLFVPRRPTERDEDEAPVPVVAPTAPPAPVAATRIEAREANEIATVREQPARKNHAALWIVAGVLVAGAAGVGGVVLYESSRSATTSNVSLSWSH